VRVVALRSFAKAQTVRLCSVLDLPRFWHKRFAIYFCAGK
jgi:hypothetical protein